MSTLIVEVCEVSEVKPHTNAERLEICVVKGWQTIVQKDVYKAGDKCVFFPPDSILPLTISDTLGVTKYLGSGGRVKATRLRGEPSYGVICKLEQVNLGDLAVGIDVKSLLGITKWEPPQGMDGGDAARAHVLFHRYTDIENIKNFPGILQEGEEVYITEKIHGTNCRMGYVKNMIDIATGEKLEESRFEFVAGSHRFQRKPPTEDKGSLYWSHMNKTVEELLFFLQRQYSADCVILFGEIYGVQKGMRYGVEQGKTAFRFFDVSIDGKYMDFHEKLALTKVFDVEMVPTLYIGPFSQDILTKYTDGETTLGSNDKFKGREGIVIGPTQERHDPKVGRVIFKSISADYLGRNDIGDEN